MAITVQTFPDVTIKDYATLRSEIRSGDILLCSGSSAFSHLIQKATNSVWSHVAFILRLDNIDRIMVLESVESIGVRTVPLSAYVVNYNGTGQGYAGQILLARHSKFDLANIANLSKTAIDLLGYPYNKQEIIDIAARIISKVTGFDLPPGQIQSERAFICSEYAYKCYQSVGVQLDCEPGGFVTPADFAKSNFVNAVSFIQLTS
jgi:hypothetical protein